MKKIAKKSIAAFICLTFLISAVGSSSATAIQKETQIVEKTSEDTSDRWRRK